MNNLYQKQHGLPGVSLISGANGDNGTDGNNILFGYVGDFFDNTEVEVDNIVRIAARNPQNAENPEYYTGIVEVITDTSTYVDTSRYASEYISSSTFVKLEDKMIDEEYELDRNKVSVDTSIYRLNDSSVPSKKNVFTFLYLIDNYTTLYKTYNHDSSLGENVSDLYVKVDVYDNVNNVTGNKKDTSNYNSDVSFLWITFPDAKVNNSDFFKNPISENLKSLSSLEWPYKTYDLDKLIDNEEYKYYDLKHGKLFTPPIPIIDGVSGREQVTTKPFTVTIEDIEYAYHADANDRLNIHYNDSSLYFTFEDIENRKVATIEEIITKYKNYFNYFDEDKSSRYNASVYQQPVDYVKHKQNVIDTLLITDKLKSDIKAGDVLYFYTNQNAFDMTHSIEYMVVITKELEQCTLEELIANATIVNPFSFKSIDYVNVGNDKYLLSTNRAYAVQYNQTDANVEQLASFGKNFGHMVAYDSEALLNIGSINSNNEEDNNTQQLMKCIIVEDDMLDTSLCINSRFDNESNEYVSTITTNEDSFVKMSPCYFKNNNIGNFDNESVVNPYGIILDDNRNCHMLVENEYVAIGKKFNISIDEYINNAALSDCYVGATVITYDMSYYDNKKQKVYSNNKYCRIKKYQFGNEDTVLRLSDDFLTNTAHIIKMWVANPTGIKFYSKETLVEFNLELKNYTVKALSDVVDIAEEEISSDFDPTEFVYSNLSANQLDDGYIDIEIPGDARNITFFVNSQKIENSYSNSWCSLTLVEDEETEQLYQDPKKYKFDMSVNDNIPQTIPNECTTTQEYIKYFGNIGSNNSTQYGCELFNALLTGEALNSLSRTLTFTVSYDYGSRKVKSVHKITQPGYIETRKIPKINISIDKDLNNLEAGNDVKNGVLCNQFQFYINVEVEDFNADVWGSTFTEDNISLNFTIENVPYDYDFAKKYGIRNSYKTYTLHSLPKDKDSSTKNYFSLKTSVLNSSVVNPYVLSQKELKDNTNNSTINFVNENLTRELYAKQNDEDIYTVRQSGVDCPVKIEFTDLKFSDVDNKKLRAKVIIEYGNPLFSKLFFRYYVSELYIKIGDEKYHLGKSNLAQNNLNSTIHITEYMYSTDTMNVYVCPIDMIANAAPTDANVQIAPEEQVDVDIKAHVPYDVIEKDVIQWCDENDLKERYINNQEFVWADFALKKRYLQDNVENIRIMPIHINDINDKIDCSIVNAYEYETDDYISSVKNLSYVAVQYDASISRKINNVHKFEYAGKWYEKDRYNQKATNSYAYVSCDMTYNVRNTKIMSAMSDWNYEYEKEQYNSIKKSENVIPGYLSTYGNGYNYLDESVDKGQYKNSSSLVDVKAYNDVEVFDETTTYSEYCMQPTDNDISAPKTNEWFKSLVTDTSWIYRAYRENNEKRVPDVSLFTIINCTDYINIKDADKSKVIPYNLTYSIYPRCAYDDENDNVIVFMLRCPQV